jgi:AbrB family looped-hinge helix DNA binding protein
VIQSRYGKGRGSSLPREYEAMALAHSKVTAQGQISVPAAVRKKLGVRPGSVLEWDEEDGKIVVRRVGKYTFEDIHKVLFPDGLLKGDPRKS